MAKLKKVATKTISLELPSALLDRIKQLANQYDVDYQSLMKIILADAVEHSFKK